MKAIHFAIVLLLTSSCNQGHTDVQQQIPARTDRLQQQENKTYKPGLGDFMLAVQMHHAKLWFAGINSNWKLADFELGEIQETFQDVQTYNRDRPEIKTINMINPPLENISKAIKKKNVEDFKSSFSLLTSTCNNCHRINQYEFNVITIPNSPPVNNQNFEVQK